MNLPDEVMTHPTIEELTELAIDMLILGNVSLLHLRQHDSSC